MAARAWCLLHGLQGLVGSTLHPPRGPGLAQPPCTSSVTSSPPTASAQSWAATPSLDSSLILGSWCQLLSRAGQVPAGSPQVGVSFPELDGCQRTHGEKPATWPSGSWGRAW